MVVVVGLGVGDERVDGDALAADGAPVLDDPPVADEAAGAGWMWKTSAR